MPDNDVLHQILERLSVVEEKVAHAQANPEDQAGIISAWLPEAFHEPGVIGGIVVDEGKAREGDCNCIPLGEKSRLCYSHGVVGALSQDQEHLYCVTFNEKQASPALVERTRILRDATVLCQSSVHNLPENERLEPFMQCLVREAKKKGLEI